MDRRDLLTAGALAAMPAAGLAEEVVRPLDADWDYVADRVMGGVSSGRATRERIAGRAAVRLTGTVSTANDGGFIQIAADLGGDGLLDASAWEGLALDVIGNGETYELRLRTADLSRPWQSYRMAFRAPTDWGRLEVPFSEFVPYRTGAPFDPARLRRVGVLAVGREFEADVAVAGLRLWR